MFFFANDDLGGLSVTTSALPFNNQFNLYETLIHRRVLFLIPEFFSSVSTFCAVFIIL